MPENTGPRRPFATGSKPGPDAVDHYLEEQGFFRKHVARDASSLFRVVSEQVFDIQHYHEKIRQDCAAFMETQPNKYANEIDKNFYNYISQLRRSRTYGSLLELRVLARMYRKNVILFEPTQNLQTTSYVYVSNDSYDANDPLRVFYSHKDRHFDVIYTMDYVERLAECQAIVYSILYDSVFKLPDVKYAVERMLHDQDEEITLPLPTDPSKYKTQSGEVIEFDLPTETQCVLKDPKTCHFHNQTDFEDVVNEQKDAITVINRGNDHGRLKIFKPIDGFLYDDVKSCVRQLLDEKITPFPYKVAKALDPSIYRNTEFELWSENRKEQRMKLLDSADFSMKHQVEDKWMIDTDKYRRGGVFGMRKLQDGKIEQAVVDETAYMALDEETKKKYVILDPSAEPFKLHHLTGLSNFIPSHDQLDLTVMPLNAYRYKKRGNGRFNSNSHQNNGQYGNHHHQNNVPGNQQMSQAGDIERDPNYQSQDQFEQQQQQGNYQDPCVYEQPIQQAPPAMYHQIPAQNWSQQMVSYIPQQPMHYQQVMPYGNFTIPPPQPALTSEPSSVSGDTMNIMRDSELSSTSINWKPKESVDKTGNDLPADVQTLQFYYNVGVRYFQAAGVQRRLETVASQLENLDMNENPPMAPTNGDKTKDQQVKTLKAENTDAPPVPTNTPVTTKMIGGNFGPPGRFNNNPHGNNFRRAPFSSNRDNRGEGSYHRSSWNNCNRDQRNPKEIKFNSNVKNAPKNGGGGVTHSNSSLSYAGVGNKTCHSNAPPINAAPSPGGNNQEKGSPTASNTHYSPISPVTEANVQYQPSMIQEQQLFQPQPVQQFYQPYQAHQPMYSQQQQQQGLAMYYQQMEDGSFVVQQPPSVQYAQPCQYPIPPPHLPGHIYYPVHSYTSQVMDGSAISSNDSGLADATVYQPQAIQYYPPPQYQVPHQPVPMFYAQSPMPQTPQIAPTFPILQQPGQIHHVNSAPPNFTPIPPSADHSPSRHSDGNTAENSGGSDNA